MLVHTELAGHAPPQRRRFSCHYTPSASAAHLRLMGSQVTSNEVGDLCGRLRNRELGQHDVAQAQAHGSVRGHSESASIKFRVEVTEDCHKTFVSDAQYRGALAGK